MKPILHKLIPTLLALISLNAISVTRYVDLNSPSPTPPYTSWLTAATNIQDAIDAAVAGDLVLVTNGVYNTGGQTNGTSPLTNRVALNKSLTLQSVNGPNVTIIEGYTVPGTTNGNSAVRCAYLTNGAALIGFTITNGSTRYDNVGVSGQGGGIFCESTNAAVSNCVIIGNFAISNPSLGGVGGGVFGGTLFDCTLMGNVAAAGGGAYGSVLYNCTVKSNVATANGGGVRASILNNSTLEGNSSPSGGGTSGESTLNNCVLINNLATAGNGGGANGGALSNCIVVGNQAMGSASTAGRGGGGFFSSFNRCVITNNSALRTGGGAESGDLTNCTIIANTAQVGGGINKSVLKNCVVSDNVAAQSGGGACSNILINCVIAGNVARNFGGGTYFSSMTNCLVVGNIALSAGGVFAGTNWNSIVYDNIAFSNANYLSNAMNYCCTLPLPLAGIGNISDSPQLTDQFHVSAGSACLQAGDSNSVSGTDMDGEAWNLPPAIGCDDFHSGSSTGLLSVVMSVGDNDSTTGFATGAAGNLHAKISGNANSNYWDFGDGYTATNQTYVTHSWAASGVFSTKVWVFNSDNPGGVFSERTIHIVDQPVHYVSENNSNPIAPFLSWGTAATNIQDAIDVAYGGSSILVSNGIYRSGGKIVYAGLSNRVAATKPLAIRSVNGPKLTVIEGYQVPVTTNGNAAIRCVLLTMGASIDGFTLTNGATFLDGPSSLGLSDQDFTGGGIYCSSTNETVSNCVVVANSSSRSGAGVYAGRLKNCVLRNNNSFGSRSGGGGAYLSVLSDCVVSGNNSAGNGGGVYLGTLINVTVVSNTAIQGGGAYQGTIRNSIIYFNTGGPSPNITGATVNNSCTTPAVAGTGNFTNAPSFIGQGSGNFRLQTNSPCINAGNNSYTSIGTDLDGRPRIVNGTVDVGAYEFQGTGIGEFTAWLQTSALPTDGSADFTDADGDGMNNYGEWRSDTIPTNALSVLIMVNATNSPTGAQVTWQSVSTRNYWLERATNLGVASPFQTVATNIAGVTGTKTFTDTSATNGGPYFYRVGVQ